MQPENDLKKELLSLKSNLKVIENLKSRQGKMIDNQITTYVKLISKNIANLEELYFSLKDRVERTRENDFNLGMIKDSIDEMKNMSIEKSDKIAKLVDECYSYLMKLSFKKDEKELKIIIPKLPNEIEEAIKMDIEEIEKCFNAKAYRSCLILCGRIIEIALHRKYYEKTGIDLLESDPNIGVGKLIKKLNEAGVLYPGLNEQIDMINQLRIYSVHRKKNELKINKEQAHASILFTIDAITKMFGKSQ